MNRIEIGEYLYRFYCKRTASFQANIYKSIITADSKDIHRARLDVKKIFALYSLFEMLEAGQFGDKKGPGLFKPLFREAGHIREIQVNFLLLNKPEFDGIAPDSFTLWLSNSEKLAVKKFLLAVRKFSESDLKKAEEVVKGICMGSAMHKLRSRTESFIRQKAGLLKKMLSEEPDDKKLHKIRQHLKIMSTITTIVYSFKPGKHLDEVITALNKTEMMIGDWHDRVVLKESIDRFLAESVEINKPDLERLLALTSLLEQQCRNLVNHFIPEVELVLEVVLTNQE